MAQAPTVAVVGMRALRRDVDKLCGKNGPLNQALAAAGRRAAQPVADVTKAVLPRLDDARLAGDVRVTSSRSGAAVRMGRASIRYAGWIEFGGRREAPHESSRPYDPRGRYLFPAALRLAGVSAALYSDATARAVNGYAWTNETTSPGSIHE